jgi:hypothetical protein
MALDIHTHLPYILVIDNGNTPTRKDETMWQKMNEQIVSGETEMACKTRKQADFTANRLNEIYGRKVVIVTEGTMLNADEVEVPAFIVRAAK